MLGECYICSRYTNLEEHHAFQGANRKICDRFPRMKFYLCPECHRGTHGVHGRDGHKLNLKLKQEAQRNFEGTKEEFIKLFGRNYL